jgi:hypothetical protein
MKALKKGMFALVLTAATALAAADPLLIEGSAACFKKGYPPEEVQVAIDRATGAMYLKSPCGWQFFRVLPLEEIEAAIAISKPIEVPKPVLAATVNKLNQIRIAQAQGQVRSH